MENADFTLSSSPEWTTCLFLWLLWLTDISTPLGNDTFQPSGTVSWLLEFFTYITKVNQDVSDPMTPILFLLFLLKLYFLPKNKKKGTKWTPGGSISKAAMAEMNGLESHMPFFEWTCQSKKGFWKINPYPRKSVI